MKDYDYVGSGLAMGPVVGADFPAGSDRVVIRFGGHASWIRLKSDFTDPSTPTLLATLSMDVLYRFRRT